MIRLPASRQLYCCFYRRGLISRPTNRTGPGNIKLKKSEKTGGGQSRDLVAPVQDW